MKFVRSTYSSTVWTLFKGQPRGKLVRDYWQPFILGMIEIVLGTPLTPEQLQYLGFAKHSAESLVVVINDILDFSKIEAGKLDARSICLIASVACPIEYPGARLNEMVTAGCCPW